MKKALFPTLLLAGLVTGCSLQNSFRDAPQHEVLPEIPAQPTAAWVDTYLPAFREVAQNYPTAQNVRNYHEVSNLASDSHEERKRLAQINRKLTMTYGNYGRGGAAKRQPGYVHVVNEEYNQLRDTMGQMSQESLAIELAEMINGISEEKALEVISAIGLMEVPGEGPASDIEWISDKEDYGYSMYELSRWSRFCEGGQGMDEADWRFVTDHNSVPPPMFDQCDVPQHGYDEYIDSWQNFCEGDNPSRTELGIVRDSVRPQSTANPCKALN